MWCLLRSGCLPMAGHKERLTLRGGDGKGQGKKGGRLKKGGKKAKYGGRKQKRRDNDSDESSLFVSEPISSSASDTRTSPIKKPSLLSLRGDDGAAGDPQRGLPVALWRHVALPRAIAPRSANRGPSHFGRKCKARRRLGVGGARGAGEVPDRR